MVSPRRASYSPRHMEVGRGWVATAHLTALKTMSSNLKSDFESIRKKW